MSKEYSWKDGWALTYPHPLPEPPKLKYREMVFRCKCSGMYVVENHKCSICGQIMEGQNDNNS